MQTFLPVPSFVKSMEYLDNKRLGKQRVEAAQILEILLGQPFLPKNLRSVVPFEPQFKGWNNHPAVLMWRNHEEWLKKYLACAIGEWYSRDFNNSISVPNYSLDSQSPPPWLGYEPFHKSHRSKLISKLPSRYLGFWPDEEQGLPYYWPSDHVIVSA